jgi:hypothetical protein
MEILYLIIVIAVITVASFNFGYSFFKWDGVNLVHKIHNDELSSTKKPMR